MNSAALKRQLGQLRRQTQKTINDTYIWATFAASALERSLHDADFLKKQRFRVPSRKPIKEVPRSPEQVTAFLHNAAQRDLFASVFVFLVAQVEAFMVSVCTLVLRYDSRRLKMRIPGINHTSKIDTSEIIDATSRDELIDRLIEGEMQAAFYSRPETYFIYLERVIGITCEEELRNEWIEIKETRDIIVHNVSIVNDTYLHKSGGNARATLGTVIPFDKSYFERSIATMKSIAGRSEVSVRKSVKSKA